MRWLRNLRWLFILLLIVSCSHKVEPDSTSIEIGSVENGNDKTTKKIKQSWKWSKE